MARPRSFDEDAALAAAIDCFWRRGLEATSVRELSESMGIAGPSLYNAFGDKRGLFARALERYAADSLRDRIDRAERMASPRAAVAAFIAELIERSLADPDRRGCFIVNSALDVAPHDPELGSRIAGYLDEIRLFFEGRVAAGQASGEIAPDRDAADMGKLLLGVVLGIRVLARARPERALLEGVARPALAMLGARIPDAQGRRGGAPKRRTA